jgi:hypothetical protein
MLMWANRYLIADYTHSNFTLTQRHFTTNAQQTLIPITPSTHSTDSVLSTGVIVSIAIGCLLFLLFVLAGAFFWYRLRQKRRVESPVVEKVEVAEAVDDGAERVVREEPLGVVEAPNELTWGSPRGGHAHEMDSGMVQEIGGREVKAELPGG